MKISHFSWSSRSLFHCLLAILLWSLAGISCTAQASSEAEDLRKPATLAEFAGGIIVRSADIIYLTEQDSEVFLFYRNSPVEGLDDAVFLNLLRRPPETPVEQQSWAPFFQLRTSRDATGRWRALQQYLEANLTNVTIFRVPRDEPYDSQYDLYAVGLFNARTVVGVQMFGVAT